MGDLVHGNSDLLQSVHVILRGLKIFSKTQPRFAVVAEGAECGGRHGVDRIGADQLLDINYIAVIWVLGTGAGPQDTLALGTTLGELLPTLSAENTLVALVR